MHSHGSRANGTIGTFLDFFVRRYRRHIRGRRIERVIHDGNHNLRPRNDHETRERSAKKGGIQNGRQYDCGRGRQRFQNGITVLDGKCHEQTSRSAKDGNHNCHQRPTPKKSRRAAAIPSHERQVDGEGSLDVVHSTINWKTN